MCRAGQDDLLWNEPERSSQPSPVHNQPAEDDLDAWASLTSEPDEMATTAPEPDSIDEREDRRLRGSGEQTALKTPPAPRQRAGSAGADMWAPRRGGSVQRSAAQPLQRASGTPRKSGWVTSGDDHSGMHPFRYVELYRVSWSMAPLRHLSVNDISYAVTHPRRRKQWICFGDDPVISQVNGLA